MLKRLLPILLLASLMVMLVASCDQSSPSGKVAELLEPPSPSLSAPAPLPTTPPDSSTPTPLPTTPPDSSTPTPLPTTPPDYSTPVPTPVTTELPILSIINGDVFVLKPGASDWLKVQAGMVLELGDVLKAGDFSSAEITFFEGSVLELRASSQIRVISSEVLGATGSTTIAIKQEIGKTISRVNKLFDSASQYTIETPAGVAAVRGSVMYVYVDDDGITKVTNKEGTIFAIAQGIELKIRKNRTAIIIPGKAPRLLKVDEEEEEEEEEEPWNG